LKIKYAQKKRVSLLATRFLHSYDSLSETKELNQVYHSSFLEFIENLLIKYRGYQKNDPPPKVHRPRKIGQRPPKRKFGKRPPRIGELISTDDTALTPYREKQIRFEISSSIDDTKPSWYKKAWRKVMLEVHPDRVDAVSKGDLDKLGRLQIGDRLRSNKSSELLIACATKLNVAVDLNIFEQEKILRSSSQELVKKTQAIQETASWLWGESNADFNIRLNVVKSVLDHNNIEPIDDSVLMDHIVNNLV
jgi:hypothetical protein